MKQGLTLKCIRRIFLFGVLSLFAVAAFAAPPQNTTAVISGSVVDAGGGAVPQATVAVTSESTSGVKKDTTDGQGHFSVTGLLPGQYTVDISATGFTTDTEMHVQLTAGQTQTLAITLKVLSMIQGVTVEANDSDSVAAHLAPMDAQLDEHSARTEIKSVLVKNFTSPIADFGELVEMAPGTFSISTNGIGLAQDKTYFRGFPDGDYDIDFDGVPFYDTNTPTHHTWAFFPPPWVGSVDFDRSPGSASTIGPTPFGGSIHLLSPEMLSEPLLQASISYGSFNTVFMDGHLDSGPFGGREVKYSPRYAAHDLRWLSDVQLSGAHRGLAQGSV
jgi:iron complex outermembrane recepter protein